LFATETFSIGINMPAKTVVFTKTKKFDGKVSAIRVDVDLQAEYQILRLLSLALPPLFDLTLSPFLISSLPHLLPSSSPPFLIPSFLHPNRFTSPPIHIFSLTRTFSHPSLSILPPP
jgi:hypothetical protein